MFSVSSLAALLALPTLTFCATGSWDLKWPDTVSATFSASVKLSNSSLDIVTSIGQQSLISATSLGFTTSKNGNFTTGLEFVSQSMNTISKSYSMKTGKRRSRSYTHAEHTFKFRSGQQTAQLKVILARDGLAHRWILDQSPGQVTKETGRWKFATDGKAWLQESYTANYEAEWKEYTISAANGKSITGFPALFRPTTPSTYVLLSESDLDGRYAGSHLTHSSAAPLEYGLELYNGSPINSTATGLATPWRVAILGDLPTVTTSTLIDDLAPDSKVGDVSWAKPGVSSWSWLTDGSSPRNETRQYDFVDLSAREKWDYVLLDEGWTESWAPRVVTYAKNKGIGTILWFHHGNLLTQSQRDSWLPKIVSWGAAGIKVDFMESDGQDKFQWYDAMLADSAKYKLMINFHGATIPRGTSRTWPHIMSFEAIRGEENGMSATRSVIVPFTRNVVGSMDFTPVVLSRAGSSSSYAQEIAMAIVYETGWQHMSDNPESYAKNPIAAAFLSDFPTEWDETILLDGEPAQRVVLARKSLGRWFIGGMKAGQAGKLTVDFGKVLGTGNWNVHIVSDGSVNGQVSTTALAEVTRTAKAGDVWEVNVATNGGFAAIATPA